MNSNINRSFAAALLALTVIACSVFAADNSPAPAASSASLEIASGPFNSSFESFKQYQCPDWFRDAKLGIWAVWGPEAVPEQGDWYAQLMYKEGSPQYKYHVEHYGHPSKFGYKDIIPLWKAEKFDPDRLMQLYKKAGAKYFCVIANHHDNFDCWNSKFTRWNSVNMGPHRDIVGDWKKAADIYGLRFGVTEHLGPSYSWFSVAKKADKQGPMAGVPYDGTDPKYADLYHAGNENAKGWYAENAPVAWKTEWFNRIKDLVDSYKPDLLYTDGGICFEEYGRSLVAHFYNQNIQSHGGKLDAVYTCKQDSQGRWVQDLERGIMGEIRREPWQTDTCVGGWYYKKGMKYKSTGLVIGMLIDIVSKNGNLLLNFPPRPDGSLDEEEEKILDGMAKWMAVNGEAIYATRPFKVYGEGPAKAKSGGFNENKLQYSPQDIRFTVKGDALYAFCLAIPEGDITIKSLGKSAALTSGDVKSAALVSGDIKEVRLLGYDGKLEWSRGEDGLTIKPPAQKPCEYALAFKITGLTDLAWDGSIPLSADGSLQLEPEKAELHGSQLKVETRGGHPSIGFWDKPEEWVSWNKVKITKPGIYEISAEVSSAKGETEITVEVAGQQVSAKTPKTANWDDFKSFTIGKIEIKQAGEYDIKVRARAAANWKPIGLAWIALNLSK